MHLLSDRDNIFKVVGVYADALKGKQDEVNKLTMGLRDAKETLENSQIALLEAKNQLLVIEQLREHGNKEMAKEVKQVIDELDQILEVFDLEQCPKFEFLDLGQ